jgi:hypothetical protein
MNYRLVTLTDWHTGKEIMINPHRVAYAEPHWANANATIIHFGPDMHYLVVTESLEDVRDKCWRALM